MSIRIKTERPGAQTDEALYATEKEGLAALDKNLATHRALGHVITPQGDQYTVRDKKGNVVQVSTIIRTV